MNRINATQLLYIKKKAINLTIKFEEKKNLKD